MVNQNGSVMRNILITYTAILALGVTSLLTGIHYFANIAGFIGAIGFLLVFFKDRDEEKEFDDAQLAEAEKRRKYWYIVFGTGIFFSLLLGSLWNHQMGNMG